MLRVTDGVWCDTDTMLAEAHTVHERSKCAGGCGHYVDEAYDDDNEGGYEVEQVVCHACAARDQWQRDNENSAPEPGTLTWIKRLVRDPRRKRRNG